MVNSPIERTKNQTDSGHSSAEETSFPNPIRRPATAVAMASLDSKAAIDGARSNGVQSEAVRSSSKALNLCISLRMKTTNAGIGCHVPKRSQAKH